LKVIWDVKFEFKGIQHVLNNHYMFSLFVPVPHTRSLEERRAVLHHALGGTTEHPARCLSIVFVEPGFSHVASAFVVSTISRKL
jgi:hypothetical protein